MSADDNQKTRQQIADQAATLRERLGPHSAPPGWYEHLKALPFGGRVSCNVDTVEAGSWQEIVLDYEVGASGIADGAWLKATFKFYSDWALFQTTDPSAANYLSAEYHAGPLAAGQSTATVQSLQVRFDQKGHERPYQKAVIVDIVDGFLHAGDRIVIRLGDRRGGGPGTRVQTFVEDGFRFRLYVDPLGTSRFVTVPGDVVIRVAHGPAARLFLHAPRFARPGQPVAARVSALDRWGNIVQRLDQPLQWQLLEGEQVIQQGETRFAADDWASLALPALQPAAGTWRWRVSLPGLPRVPAAEFRFDVADDFPTARPWYADLHVHAHDTVGTHSPAYNARYARDVGGLDVFGYTANDFQITDRHWDLGVAAVAEFNQPGEFVAFPVQEWCGSSTAGGDHKVVFLGDAAPDFPYNARGEHNRTLQWNEDMKGHEVSLGRWPVEELWAAYVDTPEQHLVIPHVGGRRYVPDWHHPELERLVEIASTWGHFGWLYQDVIGRGYKLGAAANSDEHRGRPGAGAPGVQVFGVHGGITGVLAERLDKASIGRALRARRTWASTGEHAAVLVRSGEHLQGDDFTQRGAATLHYRFLGQSGWDWLAAYDHSGLIWERDLQRELGYSDRRLRLRWGGARIRDRYRWAAWRGRIRIEGGTLLGFGSQGFEHLEESSWRSGPTEISFRSDTYGDADTLEIEVDRLDDLRITVEGTIDGFVKVGDPLQRNPFVHRPEFHWQVSGEQLLREGRLQLALGGTELFLALERLSDQPLPADVSGSLTIEPHNAPFGHRPVYFHGRQRDDGKVWSSAMFITFAP